MKSSPHRPHSSAASKPGFALVATLIMLVLLMVLTLGMTTLSSISLRSAGRDKTYQRAQSNARLALQLAVGDLQGLAGPDNRITAPSSIRGETTAQPHLTGVWEGWKWDGKGSTPDWEKEKESRFKGWLVSTNKLSSKQSLQFADAAPVGETVNLLTSGDKTSDNVNAELVSLDGASGKKKEGFAWAVFDQSQKANISLSNDEDDEKGFAKQFDRLSASHELGFKSVKSFDWKALSEKKDQRQHLVTIGQSRLLGLKKKDVSFHDVTATSFGLLTDVAKGGFSQDLSRLFDSTTLPSEYQNRFIYSGEDAPLVQPPARFAGANPLPSPDPSWALLHSHYRLYDRIGNSKSPMLNVNLDTVKSRTDLKNNVLTNQQNLRNEAFNQQQIAPVIAKTQFVFSLAFGFNKGTLTDMWAAGKARSAPASLKDQYITWLVIDPVVTLWNPYNVPIQFNELSIELHRIPMAFKLYKNGKALSANFTRLTDAHTQADFTARQNKFYLLKLQPEIGKGTQLLQPGEHMVFTAQEWTKHGNHDYNKKGVVLRPGFNPPAGGSSSEYIGGVTTQNLFVGPGGGSTGTDYGKTIRTVAVKGGDQIQIEVKPDRANADTFTESGGKEVTAFLKYFVGVPGSTQDNRKIIGGIELDYGAQEKELLPAFEKNEMPTIVVNSAIPKNYPNGASTADEDDPGAAAHALRYKEPFLIATFQQKTERDSRFPSRSWINNSPTNLYASAGMDQAEDFAHQQYEFKWEAMTDWPPDSPTIEIANERNRGFGGSGVYAQTGSEFATFSSVPITPAHSLGQFSHAPLNAGGQLPLTTRVFANSFSSPLISDDKAIEQGAGKTYLDHSYLANNALFDSYFLSSVADHPALSGGTSRDAKQLLNGFFKERKSLPNTRFKPYLKSESAGKVVERLNNDKEAYKHIAANLLIEAPFNINSTSVAAWQALLSSNLGEGAPLADGKIDEDHRLPVMRNLPSVGANYDSSSGGLSADQAKWNGYRRLTEDQIEELAKELVEEVKERGPFQSIAEFVNRQPGSKHSKYGAVQAAIERAKINESVLDSSYDFTGITGSNAEAGSGNTADGAPAVITQSDILTPIIPQLTARGDTFVIRAYGEAIDDSGHKARAWCEATVQRYPGYVDPTDQPTALPTSSANKTFGRRFEIISFRWLKSGEI